MTAAHAFPGGESALARVEALFEDAERELRRQLDEVLARGPEWYREERRLRRLLEATRAQMEAVRAGFEEESLARGFGEIYAAGASEQSGIIGQAFQWYQPHVGAVDRIAQDTFADLLTATQYVEDSAKTLIRQAAKLNAGRKVAGGRTAIQAGNKLAQQLRESGIGVVTYRNGARHGVGEYSRMVMRTKTAVAYNMGGLNHATAAGAHFFEIFDGSECGLSYHDDPTLANGLIVPADVAAAYVIAHPNCRRSFGARLDVNSLPNDAPTFAPSTTEAQRADQAAFEKFLRDSQKGRPKRTPRGGSGPKAPRVPRVPRTPPPAPAPVPEPVPAPPRDSFFPPADEIRYDGELPEMSQEWLDSLTEDERKALYAYTSEGAFRDVNEALRGNLLRGEEIPAEIMSRVELLDSAIAKAGDLPEPVLVYRGVQMGPIQVSAFESDKVARDRIADWAEQRFVPGEKLQLGGFQSTTPFVNPALDASLGAKSPGIVFEIKATQGAVVRPPLSRFDDEAEILLARETEYRVVNVERRITFDRDLEDYVERTVVQVEQIPRKIEVPKAIEPKVAKPKVAKEPAVQTGPVEGTARLRDQVTFVDAKAEKAFGDLIDSIDELHGQAIFDDAAVQAKFEQLRVEWVKQTGSRAGYFGPAVPESGRLKPPPRSRKLSFDENMRRRQEWVSEPRVPRIVAAGTSAKDVREPKTLLAFAHEVGHRTDYIKGGFKSAYASQGIDAGGGVVAEAAATAFRDAMKNSPTVQALDDWCRTHVSAANRRYASSPEELWARAYSQWVATKVGGPLLEEGLPYWRNTWGGFYQWPDDEFARDIAPAIERVLRDRGLMR